MNISVCLLRDIISEEKKDIKTVNKPSNHRGFYLTFLELLICQVLCTAVFYFVVSTHQ